MLYEVQAHGRDASSFARWIGSERDSPELKGRDLSSGADPVAKRVSSPSLSPWTGWDLNCKAQPCARGPISMGDPLKIFKAVEIAIEGVDFGQVALAHQDRSQGV